MFINSHPYKELNSPLVTIYHTIVYQKKKEITALFFQFDYIQHFVIPLLKINFSLLLLSVSQISEKSQL